MNTFRNQINSFAVKIDRRHIQLAIIVITLTMLALGVAAPAGFGDHGPALLTR
jgi:hypothetical protein